MTTTPVAVPRADVKRTRTYNPWRTLWWFLRLSGSAVVWSGPAAALTCVALETYDAGSKSMQSGTCIMSAFFAICAAAAALGFFMESKKTGPWAQLARAAISTMKNAWAFIERKANEP